MVLKRPGELPRASRHSGAPGTFWTKVGAGDLISRSSSQEQGTPTRKISGGKGGSGGDRGSVQTPGLAPNLEGLGFSQVRGSRSGDLVLGVAPGARGLVLKSGLGARGSGLGGSGRGARELSIRRQGRGQGSVFSVTQRSAAADPRLPGGHWVPTHASTTTRHRDCHAATSNCNLPTASRVSPTASRVSAASE